MEKPIKVSYSKLIQKMSEQGTRRRSSVLRRQQAKVSRVQSLS